MAPDRARSRGLPPHRHAHHHGQLIACSFVDDAPLVRERLLAVVQSWAAQLVRIKGFVQLAGERERSFLELAGTRLELRPDPSPPPAGDVPARPRTELVFIGDDLDEPALHRALWACRAGG